MGLIQFWDAATGRRLYPPIRLPDPVLAGASSPSGKWVVTGGADGLARIWEVRTGKSVGPPLNHEDPVVAVAFSPDGRTILTASGGSADRGTVRLWDAATAAPLGQPLANPGLVSAVAFSPDGRTILTGGGDGDMNKGGKAQLWDAATGRPLTAPLPHQGFVWAVAFSPDGRSVVTGGADKTARLWEVGWKVPEALQGGGDQITLWAQVFTGLGRDADGAVRLLDERAWQDRRQRLENLGNLPMVLEDSLTWHRREAAATEARGQWYAAAWHLECLVRAEPAQWQGHNRLGRAWMMQGAWDKALAETRQAIGLGKEEWEPWHTQGLAHARQGQWGKALADFSQAVKRGPKHPQPWHERGRVYAQMGQWYKAAADFDEATRLPEDPGGRAGSVIRAAGSAEVLADLALARLRLGDKQEYVEVCDLLRVVHGETPDPYRAALIAWVSALSPVLEREKRRVEEEDAHQLELAREGAFNRGNPLARARVPALYPDPEGTAEVMGQLVELAQRAAAAKPGDYHTMRALGASLYRAGSFGAAVEQLSTASTTRKEPAPAIWLFLAMAHHRLGHKEEAQSWLDNSVRWIERARQAKSAEGTKPDELSGSNLSWDERLALELLQREAEALVKGS
jgi:tetratricopeptide (TPR) repeat protein